MKDEMGSSFVFFQCVPNSLAYMLVPFAYTRAPRGIFTRGMAGRSRSPKFIPPKKRGRSYLSRFLLQTIWKQVEFPCFAISTDHARNTSQQRNHHSLYALRITSLFDCQLLYHFCMVSE